MRRRYSNSAIASEAGLSSELPEARLLAKIEVQVLQARRLPRGLRRPSGVVAVVVNGNVVAQCEPVWRDTAPVFNFHVSIMVPYLTRQHPEFEIVVRDRSGFNIELGRARLVVNATEVCGWRALHSVPYAASSHADVLVAARWAARPRPSSLHSPLSFSSVDRTSRNVRSVHRHTGRLFRSGIFTVHVAANAVPVPLAAPLVTLGTSDQVLRATETPESRINWGSCRAVQDNGKGKEMAQPGVVDSDSTKVSSGRLSEFVLKLPTADVSSRSGLYCFSKSAQSTFRPDHPDSHFPHLRGPGKSELVHQSYGTGLCTVISADKSVFRRGAKSMATEPYRALHRLQNSTRVSPESAVYQPKRDLLNEKGSRKSTEAAFNSRLLLSTLLSPVERRNIDFGSFSFALLQGILPSSLSIFVTDSSSHLPNAMAAIFDQNIELPAEIPGFGPRQNQTNFRDMQVSLVERGPANAKISLSVRIAYTAVFPLTSCNIVTPRFRQLMSSINNMTPDFKNLYPHAECLTYLLVGGLFTNHYPTYFTRNIDFLQEKLCLPRVQSVPIHTESGVMSNAIAIRDAISKTCSRRNSIVLIGHSKGGVDILEAITRYPEIVPFVYGIISFQAPFSGCFAIDFLTRSKLAIKALSGAIETLWRGEKESFQDLSYSSRNKELNMLGLFENNICGETMTFRTGSAHVFRDIPIIAVASCATFEVFNIRSPANAAGVASMAPIAQLITNQTGFRCDGLVIPADARIPFCDLVYLEDMMHTEPALYVPGTVYPPGEMTASVLILLFEKAERSTCFPNQ